MKTPGWDELVFKNRNRSYGAYVLRKGYPNAVVTSFLFMLLAITLLFVTSPVLIRVVRNIITGDRVVKKTIYIIEPPEDMVKKQPTTSEIPKAK